MTVTRIMTVLAVLAVTPPARADDRITVGYMAARPITAEDSGLAHSIAARWDRLVMPWLEVGAGVEAGFSSGDESVDRFAVLPGLAFVERVGDLSFRLEQQIGWQVAHGKVTLDGIPLRGTETRGFHYEGALAVDAMLTSGVDLRARIGVTVDGLYPVGHSSTRVGPFVGVAAVFRL